MKNEAKIIELVSLRFPKHKELIAELIQESESFKSLCEDYYDCRTMLDESIKKSNRSNDLCKEYQVMLAEIEDELLERVTI